MAGVWWVQVAVAAGFLGLAVLAFCAVRLFRAVGRLGRELERTRRRLEPKQRALRGEFRTLQDGQDYTGPRGGVRST
ncbi:hypothetical protein DPM19_17015 [Actinomadura craniellae]|uniref:Uncharacterized protein n=1 Tax=Actinomadura craniellae TaxID=2231787 RepID=A0A365H4P4_9ACTN|nr:hypothetical protein DPM19_17015 [Actinomadura craniellae]